MREYLTFDPIVPEILAILVPIDKSPSTIWNLTTLGESTMFALFVLQLCVLLNPFQQIR
jgi:hypothetical protein